MFGESSDKKKRRETREGRKEGKQQKEKIKRKEEAGRKYRKKIYERKLGNTQENVAGVKNNRRTKGNKIGDEKKEKNAAYHIFKS